MDNNGPRLHGEIGFDNEDVLALLSGLDRLRRDDNRIGLCGQREDGVNKLPRPKPSIGIRKGPLELDRSSGSIDRVVHEAQHPLLRGLLHR